jgi:hypothetical protein
MCCLRVLIPLTARSYAVFIVITHLCDAQYLIENAEGKRMLFVCRILEETWTLVFVG